MCSRADSISVSVIFLVNELNLVIDIVFAWWNSVTKWRHDVSEHVVPISACRSAREMILFCFYSIVDCWVQKYHRFCNCTCGYVIMLRHHVTDMIIWRHKTHSILARVVHGSLFLDPTRPDPATRWPDPTRDCRQKVWLDPTHCTLPPPHVLCLVSLSSTFELPTGKNNQFFNTIFVSSHMYPENPEGTQVIVGSMNMGYISDTARNQTHNLCRPKCEPIPLGHSDGCNCCIFSRETVENIYLQVL